MKEKGLKLYLALLALAAGCGAANSMPARRVPVEGFMQDGTPVTAIQYGDENYHYYVSQADGSILLREGETFVAASTVRRAKSPRSVPGLVPGTTFPATGSPDVAVVLVEYQDVKFNLADPADYFTRMLNEENFSDYHATGSARDYFIHSSLGKFSPNFVVMGPVTLQKNREYYGGNDAWGQDNAPQKMVIEACRQLNAEVDFSRFDCDGDGYIDNVFVVYAGRGEASGGSSDCVWPHSWALSSAEPGSIYTFDNVRLNRYACSNEWELSDLGYGYRPVGIGSFVHEFAHVMGLPDLYSTVYDSSSFTPGEWSAMDYGPYNNDMCTPPQFSAWERASLGYIELKPLPAEAANAALEPLEEGEAYIIPTVNENEYFILENRQQKGWDAYVPGHGMLIWHIDYDEDLWRGNSVNNDGAHNHVDLIEADGILTNDTRSGDSFPGTAGVTSITLRRWNNAEAGYSLTDIREIETRVAFRVNGGAADIATPQLMEVEDVKPASFTARWQPVEGATAYRLELRLPGGETRKELAAADATSHTFTSLEPSTDYAFTISADDGCFGSAPTAPVTVTTAPPTFDYFRPEALEATEVSAHSFTANWEPLDGATSYTVNLYRQTESEPVEVTEDFGGDIEHLPSGWTTSSRVTYGMASYSGVAVPSLRMAADGDELVISRAGSSVSTLEFWNRGNSTTSSEAIFVEGLADDGWVTLETFPVETAQGGVTRSIIFEPFEWQTVRIRFSRPSKGSLALDDVTAAFTSPVDLLLSSFDADGAQSSLTLEDLLSETVYRYGVVASDGEYLTPESELVTVKTLKSAAIGTVGAEEHYVIYDISGRIVARGKGEPRLPAGGLYIISRKGERPVKIIAK